MICRYMPSLLALYCACVTFFPVTCLAAEERQTTGFRDYGAGATAGDWNVQMSVSHLPAADLHGVPGDAGISDYRLKLARNIGVDDRLTLTLGGGYGLKHIDVPSTVVLPQELHALFLEAGARYRISDSAFASVKLYPGFYSDFKEFGTGNLRLPILALGGYSFENGFSVVGGCIYRFGYHTSQFIPALGFSYQPDPFWRFDLIAPRPGITYFATRQLQLFVAGDFASDEYEIRDPKFGAQAMKYSDYKVMGGFNYLPTPTIKISTSMGYAFDRKFAFFEGNRPDMRIDDVPFFRVSLDLGW